MDISNIGLEERTLGKVIESRLAARPDAPMLQDAQTSLSASEAWHRALSFARTLDEVGVGWQEPVALMLDNHVDNVLCWLGTALTGRVEVSVNVAYMGEMLAHVLRDSRAALLIVEASYLARVAEIANSVPDLKAVIVRGNADASIDFLSPRSSLVLSEPLDASWQKPNSAPVAIRPWDILSLSYTSGTTGRSKAVLSPHAHAFGHAATDGLGRTAPGETRFVVLPQFHIAGRWGGVYNAFLRGGCAFIADRFHASTYWQEAKAVNASSSQLVGTMAEFLRLQPPSEHDRDHSLREIGVMPLPKEPHSWSERFGVQLTTCYGSTEVGCVLSTVLPVDDSVGQPRGGYDIRLVDQNDCEVPVGQVGELIVRPLLPWTSSVGYANCPEQTMQAWRNGWLHSGDAFIKDRDGNYFFVDRVDDALRRRGENISSAEAEYLIAKHPYILEVAIVGVPSEFQEDDVLAVIVRTPGNTVTELDLAKDLSGMLPYFMVPRYIRFVDALPKTPTEKVQKSVLRAEGAANAWDGQAAGFNPKR
jgi:crotonobetaine/carnitine-CoA ligase